MSNLSVKRASRDFNLLSNVCGSAEAPFLVSVALRGENLFEWMVVVNPPAESIYAGVSYKLLLNLHSVHYPMEPPSIQLLTPIFNPMVSVEGSICEGLLKIFDWKPTKTPVNMLNTLVTALFLNYKSYDVLNEEAAQLLYIDEAKFIERVNLLKRNNV
ncbi:unnamed protein product [Phytomonas sp. Hart1]|nr:unnamed protein product [Phytomonas sp. Hart1]|eukprot:CCW66585.1 unnamed protein product [Phytomonas sp. isolate Hart1]